MARSTPLGAHINILQKVIDFSDILKTNMPPNVLFPSEKEIQNKTHTI